MPYERGKSSAVLSRYRQNRQVVMVDYGLQSPNEQNSIEMIHRGIETAIVYLDELALLPR